MASLVAAANRVTKSFLGGKVSVDNWTFKVFYQATTSVVAIASFLVTARQFFGAPINCDAGHGRNVVAIDSWTFQVFNKVSSAVLVLSSIVASGRQFFGDPIVCDAGKFSDGVSKDVLEAYCWMYAHFKIPPQYKGPCSGEEQQSLEEIMYNSYYQWVPIFLIALAIVFYLPRCLWLSMEGGLMKFFGKGTTARLIEDPDEKRDKLVEFFRRNIYNKYNIYFYGFIFCESLNLLTVLLVFWATHRFLHGRFLFYGFEVYKYYQLPPEEQQLGMVTNPMCHAFPRIASCTYYRFGSGGGQESVQAICILALNIVNDKVFLVLWWWFVFLMLLGGGRLVFRAVQCSSSSLRFAMVNLRMHRYFKRDENMDLVRKYIHNCSKGDWFVIYQLSKNLNRPFFMDFLVTLSRAVEADRNNSKLVRNDTGDNVMDLMFSPQIFSDDTEDEKKKKEDEDEEEEEENGLNLV